MNGLSIFSLLLLLFSPCNGGDKRLKEAVALVQARLQLNQQRRYLKTTKTSSTNSEGVTTTTTTSTSSGSCSDSGTVEADCCVPSMDSNNVCCKGLANGNLQCTVKDLKFKMKACAGTQCESCQVKILKDANNRAKGYKNCDQLDCYTCPDGEISYKCFGYDHQTCD